MSAQLCSISFIGGNEYIYQLNGIMWPCMCANRWLYNTLHATLHGPLSCLTPDNICCDQSQSQQRVLSNSFKGYGWFASMQTLTRNRKRNTRWFRALLISRFSVEWLSSVSLELLLYLLYFIQGVPKLSCRSAKALKDFLNFPKTKY